MRPRTAWIRLAWIITAASLGVACDANEAPSPSLPPGTPTAAEVARTPRADALAERLAVRCTEGLVADEVVYATLRDDLAAITVVRGARPADHLAANAVTQLLLDLPPARDERLLAGGEPVFTALNARLGATVSDNAVLREALGDAILTVTFAGVYAPGPLAALYAEGLDLDSGHGVSFLAIAGDGDAIAYDLASDPRRYLVTVGHGDCPSGCAARSSELWTVDRRGVAALTATWQSGYGLETIEPPAGFDPTELCQRKGPWP